MAFKKLSALYDDDLYLEGNEQWILDAIAPDNIEKQIELENELSQNTLQMVLSHFDTIYATAPDEFKPMLIRLYEKHKPKDEIGEKDKNISLDEALDSVGIPTSKRKEVGAFLTTKLKEMSLSELHKILKSFGFEASRMTNHTGLKEQGKGTAVTLNQHQTGKKETITTPGINSVKRFIVEKFPILLPFIRKACDSKSLIKLSETYDKLGQYKNADIALAMIRTANEYWIHDSDTDFADGDIGEYNHEIIAEDFIIRTFLGDKLPDSLYDYGEYLTKDYVQDFARRDYEYIDFLKAKYGDDNDGPQYYEYFDWLLTGDDETQTPLSKEFDKAMNNSRNYVIDKYGWIRVQGKYVEMRDVNSAPEAASGLYSIYDADVYNMSFNVETHSPQKYYTNISYEQLESGELNPMAMNNPTETGSPYDMPSAFIKQMPAAQKFNPYYNTGG